MLYCFTKEKRYLMKNNRPNLKKQSNLRKRIIEKQNKERERDLNIKNTSNYIQFFYLISSSSLYLHK